MKMHSEAIGSIAAALAKAQGQITGAKKDGQSHRNKYATLASIQEAIRIPLSENEISYFQAIQIEEGKEILFTMLVHSSGEWFRTENIIPVFQSDKGMSQIQSYGATLTYLKRYQLSALVGISAADEDDDGNTDSHREVRTNQPKPSPQKQPVVTSSAKAQNGDKHKPERNHIDELFDNIQSRTGNYFNHKNHLFNVLEEWPLPDNQADINQAVAKAINHVSNKLDAKSKQTEK